MRIRRASCRASAFVVCLLSVVLSPALLFGASLVVDVTPALTNGAGWTAVGKVKTTADGKLYLGAKDAALVSPDVGFAVTAAVVTAYNSSERDTRRILGLAPAAADGWDAAAAVTHAPLEAPADYAAAWPATARVARVAAYCADGDRTSLYLTRIALYGEPLVAAPSALAASPADCSARLRWQADARAVSNRVTVSRIVATPASWTNETHYGFDDCMASQASFADQAAAFVKGHPGFSGAIFGFRTDGVLQIGTTDEAGWLGYAGRSRWRGTALRVRAKRPRPTDKPTMPVWACRGDVSNELAVVALSDDYAETVVPLSAAPDGATIWLNRPCATKTDQRVVIDDLWFYDGYRPATSVTHVVASVMANGGEARISGLKPRTQYQWQVVSYDAAGRASPSAHGAFTTMPRQGRVMIAR